MAEQSEADTLFDRLLALNRDAFAARRYPTAYYALVAAMCEAEAAQEVPALVLVQTVAEAQAAPGEYPVALPPTSNYSTLLTLLAKRMQHRVVCLCAADNVSRALPSRLTRVKQPVIASHIGGPVPGEARCTTPQTHRTRVIPHASCFAVASHTWDCGPGGTRNSSTSRSGHTWSVRPAAIAGVCGRPCVAEPLP